MPIPLFVLCKDGVPEAIYESADQAQVELVLAVERNDGPQYHIRRVPFIPNRRKGTSPYFGLAADLARGAAG